MKYSATKLFWASIYVLSISILIQSCSAPQSKSENTTDSETTDKETTVTELPTKDYYINNVQNEAVAEIHLKGEKTFVRIQQSEYFGELKSAEKLKYYDQNDEMLFAVKYTDKGFKLRDEDAMLLWKVKIDDDHIKIASNEDMIDPFRIGWSDGPKIKIKDGYHDLAELRLAFGDPSYAVKDQYFLVSFGKSLAAGVMIIEEIPENERVLIATELLRAGK